MGKCFCLMCKKTLCILGVAYLLKKGKENEKDFNCSH